MTGIDELAQKSLRYLHNKGIPPTPMAYFKAFHNVLRQEKRTPDSELDWQSAWLSKFSPTLQETLKKAQNPDEFVSILAKEIKDVSPNEHVKQLKILCYTLLGSISDIVSIAMKTKMHFMFKQSSLDNPELTGRLVDYWEGFRNSKAHTNSLKKLVNVVAQILKMPDSNGNVSKEALELSSSLLAHPESLIDERMIKHIESLLNISSDSLEATNIASSDTSFTNAELSDMGAYIVVFQINNMRFLESSTSQQIPTNKALEILRDISLKTLQGSSMVGIYKNGFAITLSTEPKKIQELSNLIA